MTEELTSMHKRLSRLLIFGCFFAFGWSSPTAAQTARRAAPDDGYKTATRLGGPSRFYGQVPNRQAVQRMMRARRTQTGIETILKTTGLSSLNAQIVQILTDASPTQLTEVDFPVGGTLSWMALRRNGRPEVVRSLRWGGRRPFKAFQFVIDDMNRTYTFVIPQDCGNLALAGDEPSRERARQDAERGARERADKERADAAAKAAAAAKERAEAAARAAEREKAEAAAKAEKERQAREQAERDRQAAEAARQEAERKAAADALAAKLKREKVDWFIAPFVGKERRVREEFSGGRCAPELGVKVGPDIRLSPTVRFAPAIGAAFNLRDGDNSNLFADAEIRKELTKGFVGAGLGVWDFTDSDLISPNLLVDFGVLLREYSNTNKLYFTGEGRLFLDQTDDIPNNFQFWGGVRYIFR
jgi:hypothetical protein